MPSEAVYPTGKLPLETLAALLQCCPAQDPRLVAGPRPGEDVAVIDMGDRYMVVKTDPITFATDEIGWYAVHVNANDVATSGATPLWMLATVLLPEGRTTDALLNGIFGQLRSACDELGITLVGGHTEVTYGLERPIVVGVLIGEVARERLITTAGARVGDRVLLVNGIPIEATALIAHERAADLRARGYSEAFIARAREYLHDPGISVVAPARIAAAHPGVHAMHDPTEGGLATGLHELAYAAGTGLRLDAARVPIAPEGARLCAEYGLDPLGAIASGSLIVAIDAEEAKALCARYRDAGIPCAHIADLVPEEEGLLMVRDGEVVPLPRFDTDEVTRVF
ncbi:MAG: hydrogenase expression/formation protein [Chloroflexi bacterium]|nr:hydrogenase expression/formation protein [Chloroflexota bacterium]